MGSSFQSDPTAYFEYVYSDDMDDVSFIADNFEDRFIAYSVPTVQSSDKDFYNNDRYKVQPLKHTKRKPKKRKVKKTVKPIKILKRRTVFKARKPRAEIKHEIRLFHRFYPRAVKALLRDISNNDKFLYNNTDKPDNPFNNRIYVCHLSEDGMIYFFDEKNRKVRVSEKYCTKYGHVGEFKDCENWWFKKRVVQR